MLVDKRTIAGNDIGGLFKAVIIYYELNSAWDWTNRIGFLEAVG